MYQEMLEAGREYNKKKLSMTTKAKDYDFSNRVFIEPTNGMIYVPSCVTREDFASIVKWAKEVGYLE